jgi:hypothetical protein
MCFLNPEAPSDIADLFKYDSSFFFENAKALHFDVLIEKRFMYKSKRRDSSAVCID